MTADHQEARWRQDLKSGSSRREMVGAPAVLHVAPQSMLVRGECLTQRAQFHPNNRINVRIMKDSIGSHPRMPLPNENQSICGRTVRIRDAFYALEHVKNSRRDLQRKIQARCSDAPGNWLMMIESIYRGWAEKCESNLFLNSVPQMNRDGATSAEPVRTTMLAAAFKVQEHSI